MKKPIHPKFLSFLCACILLGIYSHASAQFTYASTKLGYHNVRFDDERSSELDGIRLNQFVFNLDVINRPFRYLGFGASIRLPLASGFNYTLTSTDGKQSFSGGSNTEVSNFSSTAPEVSYLIKNNFGLTLFARLFFDVEKNYYLDFRYSIESYSEELNYSAIQSNSSINDIDYSRKVNLNGFGFAVGYQPSIGDNFYMTYSFAVDFIGTKDSGFSYEFLGTNSNSSYQATFESAIDDTQTAYELGFGVGYYF